MQSLLNPRNLFHIYFSDLDIQEGQHVQTSDLFKFAFLIQTHTRKWLQWLKVTPPWQVLGYLPGAYQPGQDLLNSSLSIGTMFSFSSNMPKMLPEISRN